MIRARYALGALGQPIIARDSLLLETIMLVYPVQAIEEWQQELNPKREIAQ